MTSTARVDSMLKRSRVTFRSASSDRQLDRRDLAEVEFGAGDPAAALHRAEEARAGHAAIGNRRAEAADLSNMAAYLVALDCFEDARAYASLALEAARDVARRCSRLSFSSTSPR